MTAVSTGAPVVSAPVRGGSGSEPTVCSLIVSPQATKARLLFRLSASSHKTIADMNALDRNFMNAGKITVVARLLGVASVAALVCGCASPIASAKVDPSSPVAADVAKLATADRDYPKFSEIPPKPTDVRPARVYGERAQAVTAAGAKLDAATGPGAWTLNATTSFAARARADAGPELGAPANTDTEAFANSVRKRATPPPPAKH
jgi:hypothetical protein